MGSLRGLKVTACQSERGVSHNVLVLWRTDQQAKSFPLCRLFRRVLHAPIKNKKTNLTCDLEVKLYLNSAANPVTYVK